VKKRIEPSKNKSENKSTTPTDQKKIQCKYCGYTHPPRKCPAYGQTRNKCKGKNHFAKVCKKNSVNEVAEKKTENKIDESFDKDNFFISEVANKKSGNNERAWYVDLKINKSYIKFKLDTGAEVNVIPKKIIDDLKVEIKELTSLLTSYREFTMKPIGETNLSVARDTGLTRNLDFMVVNVDAVPLLGLQGCKALQLIKRLDTVETSKLQQVLEKNYRKVFTGVGTLPFEYSIKLKPDAKPVVHPLRKVPFAIQLKLKSTLDELEKKGILAKVDKPTKWVNNLVIVEKKDGSLRLCLDPKDLNEYIMREHYKMPTAEDVAVHMNGKKVFSVLDTRDGFWQVKLDEQSSDMCTFNTPFGSSRDCRLDYHHYQKCSRRESCRLLAIFQGCP